MLKTKIRHQLRSNSKKSEIPSKQEGFSLHAMSYFPNTKLFWVLMMTRCSLTLSFLQVCWSMAIAYQIVYSNSHTHFHFGLKHTHTHFPTFVPQRRAYSEGMLTTTPIHNLLEDASTVSMTPRTGSKKQISGTTKL